MCYMPFFEVGDSRMASITSSADVTAQNMKFWSKVFFSKYKFPWIWYH